MRRPAALLALVSSSLCPACVLFDNTAHVNIASDPPGARIFVNKRDAGFVTPCMLELDPDETYRIDLEYPGYVTATRVLTEDNQTYALLWKEMYIRPVVWKFPLWLNTRDLLVPIKSDETLSPTRVYVKLERAADA
jgi:hypothetical protein